MPKDSDKIKAAPRDVVLHGFHVHRYPFAALCDDPSTGWVHVIQMCCIGFAPVRNGDAVHLLPCDPCQYWGHA